MAPVIQSVNMLGVNGFGGHHAPKRGQTPPGKRKHNHVVHVVALALLTVLVFYTRRGSYLSSSWDVHDRYLAGAGILGFPPALAPATDAEKKGAWAFTADVYDHAVQHPNARVISAENPRLVHFPAFMSSEETDHLVAIAKKDLHRSQVVADEDEKQTSNARTSFGMWPPHDKFMNMIEERIHRLVGIPREFGEGMYVLNYKQGQEYKAHNDNCKGNSKDMPLPNSCIDFLARAGGPACGTAGGGPSCGDRIATFIIVLDPAEEGGHTAFPRSDATLRSIAGVDVSSDDGAIPWYCHKKYEDRVLQAAASKGDGLLFWDYAPNPADPTDALEIDGSQHSGCPVVKGEKWIVTRWIRSSEFV